MLCGPKNRDTNPKVEQGARSRAPALRQASLVLIFACLSACTRGDPRAAFEHAEQTVSQGDLVAGWKEAERGYERFHNVSPEWASKFTVLKARALYQRGMYDEVVKVLASEPVDFPYGELAVEKRRWEGLAYTSLHRFTEAAQKLEEAERLCAAKNYPGCADVATALGTLEMARSHYAEAQGYFERVLVSARASGDQLWEADALLDLSWSANEQTHFDEALDWSNAARRIAAERGAPDVAQKALGNIGWAYYKLGDSEKAEDMFVAAEKQAEKLGDMTDQIKWLTNVGYIYMDAGKLALAEQSFQQSLKQAQSINSREDVINSLIALAFVFEQTGKLQDAMHYANEALSKAREDRNGRDEVYPLLVQGRVAAQQHDTVAAEGAFRQVAQAQDTPVFLKWEAERSLARLYEDGTQSVLADREYRTALSTFETARSELRHEDSRLPFLSNASRIYDDYIRFLLAQGKQHEALQVADYSRGRTLAEGLGLLQKGTSFKPDLLDARAVARRAGGTILFYWLGDKQSYLWAITPKKVSLFSLPAAFEIEAAMQRYRKALNGPQDVLDTANDDGRSLYRMLIAPARTLLRKDGKVFIIPDGGMNSLNFETLLVSEPRLHYWLEDITIANASSLRLLAAWHAGKEKRARRLLLFGNTVAPSQDYPELRNAAAEMESVAKHFPLAQQRAFQRNQATPVAYLTSNPEQFSYIHFVAHGIASRLSPLDSAIVLSKNSSGSDSFKLYARDIIQHQVRADLVTISACYGAGTRAYSGEGLVGLSWAFLRAGAHNVIAALWEASDVSTGQLMDQFYEELNNGESPDVALRKAKISLLHSSSSFRKPFYWAPFQLYSGS
jgi:CHAT domain-containing protein